MKKINYLLVFTLMTTVFLWSSCSDTDELCHECHLALEMADGTEMMWEIQNSTGGDEFCGDELVTVEAPAYTYEVTDSLTCTMGGHILPPGQYGPSIAVDTLAFPGAANGAVWEIHCEDHGDHDH